MRTERVTAPGDSRASVPTDHALEDDSEQPVRPLPPGRAPARTERARAYVRRHGWPALAAAAIALWSWPTKWTAIYRGLDASYSSSLHVLAHSGDAVFGRDIVFIYGPLGYLAFPQLYFGSTALPAIGARVALDFTLALLVIRLLRRVAPAWVAIVGALAFVLLGPGIESIPYGGLTGFSETALFIVVVSVLDRVVEPENRSRAGGLVIAAFAAVLGLVKGELALAGLLLAAVGIGVPAYERGGRRQVGRELLLGSGVAVVAVVAIWLVIGQPLDALPDYLHGSVEIVRGFSAAMNRSADRGSEVAAAAIVAALLLVGVSPPAASATAGSRSWPSSCSSFSSGSRRVSSVTTRSIRCATSSS